ncbi:MAG TPA: DUF4114 domain-containing protein, partial [Polyangiaceae bacterium]|nr:DUF4114 domain-containing protein [Polyangiaceae bacterium]
MNPRAQRVGGLGFALVLWCSARAFAITQPTTGVTIPIITPGGAVCADKNVQVCLNDAEGNATNINALTDAKVTPETYQPTCNLTFVPIVKGGSIVDAFGWYNVVPDPANAGKFLQPAVSQMFGMFAASGFQTGAQLSGQSFVLDLKTEAAAGRYTGGAIGFFLVSGTGAITIDPMTHQLHGDGGTLLVPQYQFFTQQAFNANNPGSTPGALYYNVLTWQSVRDPNTFYFGWEDLPIPQGSDSDFDDFVFAVTGVQCGGGGEPCDTGKLGPCKAGTMQCRKGVITCVQTVAPTTETCNAVDDDCNGQVDDGSLCPTDQICSHGVCVSNCSSGEFPCLPGLACNLRGECVEPACAGVDCGDGLACKGGNCVDACTGIICPHGLTCLNGGCVDPCQGIQCDSGFTCILGVCESCACSDCAAGQVCNKQSVCVDSGCETQTCAAGTYCAQGECHDNCEGAVCPLGQRCMSGDCIADPTQVSDAGV